MTPEELAELQARINRANVQRRREGGTTVVFGPADCERALDHIAALEAENAALREVAQAMSTIDLGDIIICPFCDAEAHIDDHAAGCPVLKARALIADRQG